MNKSDPVTQYIRLRKIFLETIYVLIVPSRLAKSLGCNFLAKQFDEYVAGWKSGIWQSILAGKFIWQFFACWLWRTELFPARLSAHDEGVFALRWKVKRKWYCKRVQKNHTHTRLALFELNGMCDFLLCFCKPFNIPLSLRTRKEKYC